MDGIINNINSLPVSLKVAVFLGIAITTHMAVIAIRRYVPRLLAAADGSRSQKIRSIVTLSTSAIVFAPYFFAIGLILQEFGVSLTAYLAKSRPAD